MNLPFHTARRENLQDHPNLKYLAGLDIESIAAASPVAEPNGVPNRKEVLYVVSGIGRIRGGNAYSDMFPGNVFEICAGIPYELIELQGRLDVRRLELQH